MGLAKSWNARSSPVASACPLGRVAATASLATAALFRTNRRSGVLLRNVSPEGSATSAWYAFGSRSWSTCMSSSASTPFRSASSVRRAITTLVSPPLRATSPSDAASSPPHPSDAVPALSSALRAPESSRDGLPSPGRLLAGSASSRSRSARVSSRSPSPSPPALTAASMASTCSSVGAPSSALPSPLVTASSDSTTRPTTPSHSSRVGRWAGSARPPANRPFEAGSGARRAARASRARPMACWKVEQRPSSTHPFWASASCPSRAASVSHTTFTERTAQELSSQSSTCGMANRHDPKARHSGSGASAGSNLAKPKARAREPGDPLPRYLLARPRTCEVARASPGTPRHSTAAPNAAAAPSPFRAPPWAASVPGEENIPAGDERGLK